ncbi:hypothetical protein [Niallia sp.]|uniref:hypothetical protein n=1 Tax=Niallia sp. TaxID=2837523 RepID=UPI00289A28FF|nr:hypothetical protein [Niallia sp.]
MSTRSATANHNKDILTKECKLTQVANTSIFRQGTYFVLSPSVQNDHCWFDLRKVNLVQFNREEQTGYLLIRFFDQFLVCNLKKFMRRMISKDNSVETHASGVHWKFNIIYKNDQYIVVNQTDKSRFLQ